MTNNGSIDYFSYGIFEGRKSGMRKDGNFEPEDCWYWENPEDEYDENKRPQLDRECYESMMSQQIQAVKNSKFITWQEDILIDDVYYMQFENYSNNGIHKLTGRVEMIKVYGVGDLDKMLCVGEIRTEKYTFKVEYVNTYVGDSFLDDYYIIKTTEGYATINGVDVYDLFMELID
jgi:hypothetical protein